MSRRRRRRGGGRGRRMGFFAVLGLGLFSGIFKSLWGGWTGFKGR